MHLAVSVDFKEFSALFLCALGDLYKVKHIVDIDFYFFFLEIASFSHSIMMALSARILKQFLQLMLSFLFSFSLSSSSFMLHFCRVSL